MRTPSKAPRAAEIDGFTLARAQRGDRTASVALVRRYERPVFAMLGRMLAPRGLGYLVDDVAQEAFLRVFAALPGFEADGPAKLSTWILCIASRLAINEIQRKRPNVEPIRPDMTGRGRADEDAERSDARRALYDAIGTLTAEQQAVFVLREYHGLDDAAIARALELGTGAVKSRLHRARARLREALVEKEVRDGEG